MSKTWETKNRIIRMLSSRPYTLSEISEKLNLSASTVSEHLRELESCGAISQVDNQYSRKWKYYKLNEGYKAEGPASEIVASASQKSSIPRITFFVIAAAAAVFLLYLSYSTLTLQSGKYSTLAFQITDPPIVPSGTNSLIISYSSLEAHYINGNKSGWVVGNSSGSLNLMELVNVSQMLGTAKVPANSTVNLVRFYITSANIIVNGTEYQVTVPNSTITVPVSGPSKVNQSSGILIDMSPTVVAIYTNNSTVFVMVPSVKAIVIGSSNLSSKIGYRSHLQKVTESELENSSSGVKVLSSTLKTSAINTTAQNGTYFSVTLTNTGNRSVTINHILVMGTPAVYMRINRTAQQPESSQQPYSQQNYSVNHTDRSQGSGSHDMAEGNADSGASAGFPGNFGYITGNVAGLNTTANISIGAGTHGEGSEAANMGIQASIHAPINAYVLGNRNDALAYGIEREGNQIRLFRMLNFIVTENGSMVLPFTGEAVGSGIGPGYVLKPGADVTFTYNGEIRFGNGHITVHPVNGTNYRVAIFGTEGFHLWENITAT